MPLPWPTAQGPRTWVRGRSSRGYNTDVAKKWRRHTHVPFPRAAINVDPGCVMEGEFGDEVGRPNAHPPQQVLVVQDMAKIGQVEPVTLIGIVHEIRL